MVGLGGEEALSRALANAPPSPLSSPSGETPRRSGVQASVTTGALGAAVTEQAGAAIAAAAGASPSAPRRTMPSPSTSTQTLPLAFAPSSTPAVLAPAPFEVAARAFAAFAGAAFA